VGVKIRVKTESPGGTHRTPEYIKGKRGVIIASHGVVSGYEIDHKEDWGNLYTVEFDAKEVSGVSSDDKILVDIHEDWIAQ
jgi:Nitrile hydratase beta subunit